MYSFYKPNWTNFHVDSWSKQDTFAFYCHDNTVSKIGKLWILPLPILGLRQQKVQKFFFDYSFERNIDSIFMWKEENQALQNESREGRNVR